MSALRPFPEVQPALHATDPSSRRAVGWSILEPSPESSSDVRLRYFSIGVAPAAEIAGCRALADEEGARFVLLVTTCSEVELHRSRVEGRQRSISGWYELDWQHVERTMETWEPIEDADMVLDAAVLLQHHLTALDALLATL